MKVTSMRKLTTSVYNVLLDLIDIIFFEIDHIHKNKLSITLEVTRIREFTTSVVNVIFTPSFIKWEQSEEYLYVWS